MDFLSDPSVTTKMQVMERKVRWGDRTIRQRGIDQTRLVLEDGQDERSSFSFLVLGDTDAGLLGPQNPQWEIAKAILPHLGDSRFTLHTGDVTYPLGSSELYLNDFIMPYRDLLLDGRQASGQCPLVFHSPFFPVPGNHDYYDLAPIPKLIATLLQPLRRWFKIGTNWSSSGQGRDYAEAFLDCLDQTQSWDDLNQHLQKYYTAQTETGQCLRYQPNQFTRLPNRYYTFEYGGVAFFALDSNTFNKREIDPEQLDWLQRHLIDSWHQSHIRGRVIYLHHSPYTTESMHCDQPEVLTVRRQLRQVLSRVGKEVNSLRRGQPLVDLILSGHSHCLEHIRTLDTGYGDRNLDWVVCGGSGASLRRQRKGGSEMMEMMEEGDVRHIQVVAQSRLYLGRQKQDGQERYAHTFLRIDVRKGTPARFVIRPFVVEQRQQWTSYPLDAIMVPSV
jgi:Calcineurin-like phosphoesterase